MTKRFTSISGDLQKRARTAKRSIRLAEESMKSVMRGHAIALTSGTITQRQLDQLGNPLGRGNGRQSLRVRVASPRGGRYVAARRARSRAAVPLLPINRQDGDLQRSLRIFRVGSGGYRLQFTAPHSKYVLAPRGTRRMVARGFWTEMDRRARLEQFRIQRATIRAMNA